MRKEQIEGSGQLLRCYYFLLFNQRNREDDRFIDIEHKDELIISKNKTKPSLIFRRFLSKIESFKTAINSRQGQPFCPVDVGGALMVETKNV